LTRKEVEEHINDNGHLPEIPSEAEVTENGINLGEMDAKLLQKIEELTLYLINQNKELKKAQTEILELKKKVESLENK
ncbi:MAG: cell wall anchor protein, partial [Bacteroidota bacterium]